METISKIEQDLLHELVKQGDRYDINRNGDHAEIISISDNFEEIVLNIQYRGKSVKNRKYILADYNIETNIWIDDVKQKDIMWLEYIPSKEDVAKDGWLSDDDILIIDSENSMWSWGP